VARQGRIVRQHLDETRASLQAFCLARGPLSLVKLPFMKTRLWGLIVAGFFGVQLCAWGAPDKVVVTAQKKRNSNSQGAAGPGGSTAKSSEQDHYEFKVQNQTLGDLSQLQLDYVIFVDRPQLGKRADQPSTVDRVSGSQPIGVLTNREPQTVKSSDFALGKSSLVGGWTYDNGGRIRAEDSVVGVWVRITQNGQLIGEYTNPPTVTKRGWTVTK
jgi:hypothetical protein